MGLFGVEVGDIILKDCTFDGLYHTPEVLEIVMEVLPPLK